MDKKVMGGFFSYISNVRRAHLQGNKCRLHFVIIFAYFTLIKIFDKLFLFFHLCLAEFW